MRVAFIAVNYNNYLISLNNVSNILSLKGDIERDVIIVDNASDEKDYHALKEGFIESDHTFLVRSDKNLGYFGGLNYGLKAIDLKKYDYVVIANNDLIYRYDFLEVLEKSEYKENCMVIAPELITIDGRYQNPQRVNKPSKKRRMSYDLYYSNYVISQTMQFLYSTFLRKKRKERDRVLTKTDIFQLTGACMILTPKFFECCGYLDDSVFMWGEEVLLAHQVEVAKGVITYDPSLYVLHMESASVNKISSRKSFKMTKASYKIYRDYYK